MMTSSTSNYILLATPPFLTSSSSSPTSLSCPPPINLRISLPLHSNLLHPHFFLANDSFFSFFPFLLTYFSSSSSSSNPIYKVFDAIFSLYPDYYDPVLPFYGVSLHLHPFLVDGSSYMSGEYFHILK